MTLSHIDDDPDDIGPFDSDRDIFELSTSTGKTGYRDQYFALFEIIIFEKLRV